MAIAVAIVARAGDVELYVYYSTQCGEVPLGPFGDDVLGAIDEIKLYSTRFIAVSIVACGKNLYLVLLTDVGRKAIAIHIAVDGIG